MAVVSYRLRHYALLRLRIFNTLYLYPVFSHLSFCPYTVVNPFLLFTIAKSTKTAVSIPRRVNGLPPCKAIACGDFHTLALSRDGKVYTWGSGLTYALGNGRSISEDDDTGADELVPYELTGQKIIGVEIVAIGGGSQHSLLLGIQDRTEMEKQQ